MTGRLDGKKIAILVADGFEQVELTEPRAALDREGAQTVLISPQSGKVKACNITNWGELFEVDVPLAQTTADEYDALHLPGGVMNPDQLRTNAKAVHFTRSFFQAGKAVSAICHAHWTLINADVLKGCTLTSWPSLQVDIQNAGGNWINQAVVRDNNLVTSRMPSDISEFNLEMIDLFATWHSQA